MTLAKTIMNIPCLLNYLFALLLFLTGLNLAHAQDRDPERLKILNDGYPRAFFFRKAESIPGDNPDFDRWNEEMSRLMGIIGKSLDEEVLGRQKNNPEFFTRFKREHPGQVVLLHLNGNARDPRFQAEDFFAGHWIYRQPAEILEDVPAETGETVIKVSDASLFRVNMGRYANRNDDIALFGLGPDGIYDWHRCEQVQLLDVDTDKNTIRVRRAQYGTRPRHFKAGNSRAAAHEVEGPWGINNNIMWFYNYSTHCPMDRDGKTAADRYLDDLVGWFGKGGLLAAYDGLEFDVLFNETRGDTNGDGIEDRGVVNGVNEYGVGVVDFIRQLRRKMGDRFIIQADGALGTGGSRSQRAWEFINGIESEGWPDLRDPDIHDWSGGLNRQNYAQAFSAKPVFNYINHKFNEPVPGGNPGDNRNPDIGFNIHRLVFAAACFTDSALCYSFAPQPDPDGLFGIWDELRCGADNQLGWLGKPVGEAVHLARLSPDLMPDKALETLVSGPVNTRVTPDGVVVSPVDPARGEFSFTISGLTARGPELTASVVMKAQPMPPYPATAARFTQLEVTTGLNLIGSGSVTTGMCIRGQREKEILQSTGARCIVTTVNIKGEQRTAINVHPPYRNGVGYTFWSRDVAVPANAELHYATGMGPKSPELSDGVWFSVQVAELENGKPGKYTVLQETTTRAHEWIPHQVSLAGYAGKTVRLKFVADCGPNDNSTTDHAYWSDAVILPMGAKMDQLTKPEAFMTWTGPEFFESTFYYRGVRSDQVDLTFHIEGTTPVTIKSLSLHSHPDVMYRLFEHGVVLANPGLKKFTFNLSEIAPGRSFRRIQATANQDTATNNGTPVLKSVTLGPKDALFLIATN